MQLKLLQSKKLIIGLTVLLILLGGLYFNTSKILLEIKGSVITNLEDKLDTTVKVKELRVGGFNKLVAEGISIKDKNNNNLIQAEELVISYSIIDLLLDYSNPIEIIKDIEINTPQINLVQQEKWNYSFLLSSNNTSSKESNKNLFPIYINDGIAKIENANLSEKLTEINGTIDLSETTGIFLDAKVEGISSILEADLIIKERDYQGEISFSDLELANLTDKSSINLPSELEIAGEVEGKVKFKGTLNQQSSFYGDLSLQNGSLAYQELRLEQINGNFGINDYGIKVKELAAQYQNMPVNINGSVFGWKEQQLNLGYQIDNFKLATINQRLTNDLNLSGQAQITGNIQGTVLNPTVRSTVKVDEAVVEKQVIKDLKARVYYKDQVLNLEELSLNYNQGIVNLDGTLNFSEPFNYIINANFADLYLAKINLDSLSDLGIAGVASGEGIISGEGLSKDKLNILGSFQLKSGLIKGYDFEKITSRFWLNNKKLFLNNTRFKGTSSKGSVTGLVGLDGDLNLDLKLADLDLAKLNQVHRLENLTGRVDINGRLTGGITTPKLAAEVKGKEIKYNNINLGELAGLINTNNKEVEIEELSIPEYDSQLVGKIDFSKRESNLLFKTKGLRAEKIAPLINQELELSGDVVATTEIKSILSNPQISSDLEITQGSILDKQEFDSLDLDLNYNSKEQKLNLEQGKISYKESELELTGTLIKDQLNFNFNSPGLIWEDISFAERLKKLTGSAKVSGSVYGTIKNPKLAAKFNTMGLEFSEKSIGDVTGRIDYRNNNIYLTDIKTETKGNQYQLNGSLNLETKEIKQINVEVKQGSLDYLNQFLPSSLGVSYQFSGQIEARGSLEQPQFDIELVIDDNDETGTLKVTGDYWLRKDSNLKLVATKFNVGVLNELDLLPYYLSGDLNLTGEITGKLTAPNFKSELKVTSGKIANLNYNSLVGEIELINGEKIIIDQRLQVEGENIVYAKGQIPLVSDKKFDFNLELQKGNLSILPLVMPGIKSAKGKGSANLEIKGKLKDPKLRGNAEVIAGSFSYPVFDREISNLNGKIKFRNNELILQDITGYYGKGDFSGEGSIILAGLMPARYNLDLTGEKIVFEHGSWQGLNDLDVKIRGTRLNPEIKGEIKAYDTRFELPVDWPKFSQNKEAKENKIKPQLDLEVIPEQNVKVVNDQIDILVQRGNLNLRTIEDKIRIIGELNSNTGRFTYYNTEFELQAGKAIFRQYDYIPNLQLEAETEIYDSAIAEDENNFQDPYHNIYLNLTGPADQLNYQLSSDSSLSQEEIIALLTGQGGLGNLLDKNYEEALTAELKRVIGEGIKTEVIYKVERSFEESLDLDQVRIKSLLEDNDSIEVEIGKFIFKDFILKYNHSFLEENKAIGFEYYFNQGLDNLMIQGNYNSEGEYELGLEASIPFE